MNLFDDELDGQDRDFLEIVDRTVTRVLGESGVRELYLIEVDKWFDKKWLYYSGRNLMPMWFSQVSLPPFPPSRIVRQRFLTRAECSREWNEAEADLLFICKAPLFRSGELARSETSLSQTVFAWFSSRPL